MLKFYGKKQVSFQKFQDTFELPWTKFYIANGVAESDIDIKRHQDEYAKKFSELAKNELKLNSDVVETLKFLKDKGIRLGVLSSRNVVALKKELTEFGISEYFDAIIGTEDLYKDGLHEKKKGHEIKKEMGITDACNVLYVGDMVIDIKTAREHNWKCGVLPHGWQSKEKLVAAKPDFTFNRFSDIQNLF
jgi:HAD superfamily hydrolase (TIGR01549 family)